MFEQKTKEHFQMSYTKYMKNCEVMTSSTHSFAYSYRLFKKRFIENYENSKLLYLLYSLSDLHQIFTVLFEIVYSFY